MSLLGREDIIAALGNDEINISPLRLADIQPASVDLHLSGKFLYFAELAGPPLSIDGSKSVTDLGYMREVNGDYWLEPGGFVLASTREKVTLGLGHVARIEGKSSIGRMGATAHVTAGFCDPGYSGHPTLEIANLGPVRIPLKVGMPIAQLAIEKLLNPVQQGYSGKYQDDDKPQASRMVW